MSTIVEVTHFFVDPGNNSSTQQIAIPAAQLGGEAIVLWTTWSGANVAVTSLADTSLNSYLAAVGPTSFPTAGQVNAGYRAWNVAAAAANANVVKITWPAARNFGAIMGSLIRSGNGPFLTDPLDGANQTQGAGTNASTTIVPAATGDYIFGGVSSPNAATAAGAGFNLLDGPTTSGYLSESKLNAASGSQPVTATTSGGFAITGMAFKDVVAASFEEFTMFQRWVRAPRKKIFIFQPVEELSNLPVEEAPAVSRRTPRKPSRLIVPSNEEIVSIYVDEPNSAFPRPPMRRRPARSLVIEDFAGSLPLEEDAAQVALPRRLRPRAASPGPEEFQGSLPLEEPSAWLLPPRRLSARSLLDQLEDFSGSLPLEEGPGSVQLLRARRALRLSTLSPEDIVTPTPTLAIDEPSPATVLHLRRRTMPTPSQSEIWVVKPVPPGPAENFLLKLGGAELPEDIGLDPSGLGLEQEEILPLGVLWELGYDSYESYAGYNKNVSLAAFEAKITGEIDQDKSKDKFWQMVEVLHAEEMERRRLIRLVKKTVTIGTITYIVWRILIWL